MKKILFSLILCLLPVVAFGASQTLTFAISSSAKTSTPNLRIGQMVPVMAQAPVAMQGMVIDSVTNHYLTKSTAIPFNTVNTKVVEVETDQDTKVYFGSDLTNYLLVYSGVPRTFILR